MGKLMYGILGLSIVLNVYLLSSQNNSSATSPMKNSEVAKIDKTSQNIEPVSESLLKSKESLEIEELKEKIELLEEQARAETELNDPDQETKTNFSNLVVFDNSPEKIKEIMVMEQNT